MKKPLSKGKKVFLIVLVVVVLLAICIFCVGLYAHNEFKKERSWLPLTFSPQAQSQTDLPDNAHDAYEYAMRLYDEALYSDETEGSWHTDVDLSGDVALPFSEADNTLINEIRLNAADAVQAMYPTVSDVKLSDEKAEDLPVINLEESDVLSYSYDPAVVFNRKGEYVSDTYELVFKVDPAFENREDLSRSSVYESVCDTLKDAMTIDSASFEVKEVEIRFYVDRLTDQMQGVDVYRRYEITAQATLTEAYGALLKDAGDKRFTVTVPYQATEHISFMWYGLRFTEDYLEQKPDDIITLPLEIHVNSAAVQGTDFTVEYNVSDPQTMEIDKDAVMTVKRLNDVSDTEGVKVTAVLRYDGKTYEDEITIYITKLDKATTGVRFWQDSFTVAVGQPEAAMPVDIRVPVNEQSEQRTEEEYTLQIDVSDPDALKVEADGKDLFATALKPSSGPVTVTVTMKCGGHTYSDQIPVTITNGTEAMNNG